MKKKYLKYFKDVLWLTMGLSNCVKKKVACLLVDNNRILCHAYNGTPVGFKNCCDYDWNDLNLKNHHIFAEANEIHSEANLISFAARYGIKTEGKILFASLSPCLNCAKLLIASGIKTIYYLEEHKKFDSGLKLLKKAGIEVKKI